MLSDLAISPAIPASDMDRAKKFYEETLGLEPGESSGEAGQYYNCGAGTRLFLYQSSYAGTNEATAAGWRVYENFDAVVDYLRDRGVEFEEYDFPGFKTEDGVIRNPDGSMAAWFKDTEGNILSIDYLGD